MVKKNKIKYFIILGIIVIMIVGFIILYKKTNPNFNEAMEDLKDCIETCFIMEVNKAYPDNCIVDNCDLDTGKLEEYEFINQLNDKNKIFYECLKRYGDELSDWKKCLN